MAAKPETTFYRGVLDRLSRTLHHEKMANPYRGGTFDSWFSGKRDLWVEWKYIELPKRDTTVFDLCTPRGGNMTSPLSALQQEWGHARHVEGRNVWVIVGCSVGRGAQGLIFDKPSDWKRKWLVSELRSELLSRDSIAGCIEDFTIGQA